MEAGLRNTHFQIVTVHLSPKWADLGKMGENDKKCGKFWMLDGKMGHLVLKRSEYMVLTGNKPGGGCTVESSRGRMAKNEDIAKSVGNFGCLMR